MPKATRKRYTHSQSVRPAAARFAGLADGSTVDKVEVGAMADASAAEILKAISKPSDEEARLSKKDRQKVKHEEFLKRLQDTSVPYAKRKLGPNQKSTPKAPLNAGMSDISTALADLLATPSEETDGEKVTKSKSKKIGRTTQKMTNHQKLQILEEQQKRAALVQKHPAFASSPFETIRIHAKNTLAPKEPQAQANETVDPKVAS